MGPSRHRNRRVVARSLSVLHIHPHRWPGRAEALGNASPLPFSKPWKNSAIFFQGLEVLRELDPANLPPYPLRQKDVHMKRSLDVRSLLLGALASTILVCAIGADRAQPEGKEISPVRFRVLEVTTPEVAWLHGGKVMTLRLAPHHGKISKESRDWRLTHETQELTLVTIIESGYEISKDDILGFQVYQHLKAGK